VPYEAAQKAEGLLKVLSIRQPWAELILQGRKTLEIRSWKTAHRGETFLHSAYNLDRAALKRYPIEDQERSAIVGKFQLDNVEELDARRWRELANYHLSDWPWDPEKCRYGFWISGAERLDVVRPCKGKSFVFELEDDQ